MSIKPFLILLIAVLATSAEVTLNVTTSHSAQVIDILDNVSQFKMHDPEFHKYWKRRFKISRSDQELFDQYKDIRSKYLAYPEGVNDIGTNSNGIFVPNLNKSVDPILTLFFASSTIPEAMGKLEGVIEADDSAFLKSFFLQYKGKLDAIISEFNAYAPEHIQQFKDELNAIGNLDGFLSDIQHFYGVTEDIEFRILVNWWPKVRWGNVGGACVDGGALVVRINDSRRSLTKEVLTSVTMHEVVHAIEMEMPSTRKRELTDVFLTTVQSHDSLYATIPGRIIFEPMAVSIGQMVFMKKFYPDEFDLEGENWYANKWVNSFSKPLLTVVEPYFNDVHTIDSAFMKEVAELYVNFRRDRF